MGNLNETVGDVQGLPTQKSNLTNVIFNNYGECHLFRDVTIHEAYELVDLLSYDHYKEGHICTEKRFIQIMDEYDHLCYTYGNGVYALVTGDLNHIIHQLNICEDVVHKDKKIKIESIEEWKYKSK